MLVPWSYLNGHHPNTTQCNKGEERNWCRMLVEESRAGTERAFRAYFLPLTTVTYFKYLGRKLTDSGNDWQVVVSNLRKAWKRLARMLRNLVREGGDLRTSRTFSNVVV